jgi:hypothetical protein
VYAELRSGKKTVGIISTEYNISKARINAIAKLKAVEAEMIRQVSVFFGNVSHYLQILFCDDSKND